LPILRILLVAPEARADKSPLPGYHFPRPSATTDGSAPSDFLVVRGIFLTSLAQRATGHGP